MIATSGFLVALECTKFVFGLGSASGPAGGAYSAPHIDVKRFLRFFYFVHVFACFNVFFIYFPNFFYFKKRWQSSERQAD